MAPYLEIKGSEQRTSPSTLSLRAASNPWNGDGACPTFGLASNSSPNPQIPQIAQAASSI